MPTVMPLRPSPRTRIRETVKTPFNTMAVVEVGDRVDLDVEGATYASWHPRQILTGYSWDALSVGCLLRHDGPPKSVLLLGLGGGTVARQLRCFLPDVRIVGVEIDPGVVDVARRHLHLADDVEVHVKDAYDFLAEGTERFDAVVDDLFLSGSSDVVRSRIPDGDTLKLVRSRVAAGGVVVANLITDVGDHAAVRASARKGFRDGFEQTRIVTPPRGLNEILVGGDRVRPGGALAVWAAHLDDEEDQTWLKSIKVTELR
ncbi:MAG: fused MFS/spermidine synthase [Deltaproteobacteria bacterium]|nr:fused MFS/spermidine synthase [Deltaproteobacteria bacterium]